MKLWENEIPKEVHSTAIFPYCSNAVVHFWQRLPK
jgi:hypothetical protein